MLDVLQNFNVNGEALRSGPISATTQRLSSADSQDRSFTDGFLGAHASQPLFHPSAPGKCPDV